MVQSTGSECMFLPFSLLSSPPPPPPPPPSPPPFSGPPLGVRSSEKRIFKQGQARRCGAWNCLSWNVGGLTSGILDDILAYASENGFHIVMIQETHWRITKTWLASGFMCIHGGNSQAKAGDCSGLLAIISCQVCSPRWSGMTMSSLGVSNTSGSHL